MKLEHPLKPSRKILPKVCTLWNRLKNGSDIATKVIKSNWFNLPMTARLPQGYVCHRILYLSLIQISKLMSVFQFRNGDTLDTWRNRTNKRNGSFQSQMFELFHSVLMPAIDSTGSDSMHTLVSPLWSPTVMPCESVTLNSSSDPKTSVTVIPGTVPRYSKRSRLNRSKKYRKGVSVDVIPEALKPTGMTPKRKGGYISKLSPLNRTLMCRLPMGVHTLKGAKSCDKARNHSCRRCGRYTSYYCLGCHLYYCDSVIKDNGLLEDAEGHLKGDHVFINADGKIFEATCFTVAHQHFYCG